MVSWKNWKPRTHREDVLSSSQLGVAENTEPQLPFDEQLYNFWFSNLLEDESGACCAKKGRVKTIFFEVSILDNACFPYKSRLKWWNHHDRILRTFTGNIAKPSRARVMKMWMYYPRIDKNMSSVQSRSRLCRLILDHSGIRAGEVALKICVLSEETMHCELFLGKRHPKETLMPSFDMVWKKTFCIHQII